MGGLFSVIQDQPAKKAVSLAHRSRKLADRKAFVPFFAVRHFLGLATAESDARLQGPPRHHRLLWVMGSKLWWPWSAQGLCPVRTGPLAALKGEAPLRGGPWPPCEGDEQARHAQQGYEERYVIEPNPAQTPCDDSLLLAWMFPMQSSATRG